jgi:hypothetical protein
MEPGVVACNGAGRRRWLRPPRPADRPGQAFRPVAARASRTQRRTRPDLHSPTPRAHR